MRMGYPDPRRDCYMCEAMARSLRRRCVEHLGACVKQHGHSVVVAAEKQESYRIRWRKHFGFTPFAGALCVQLAGTHDAHYAGERRQR